MNAEVKLISTGYDEAFEKMADGEADLVIADKRDEKDDLEREDLADMPEIAKGNGIKYFGFISECTSFNSS